MSRLSASFSATLRVRLRDRPFHDDQHGTAIVVYAALLNALRVVGKRTQDVKVVLTGVGAAGVATTRILQHAGVERGSADDVLRGADVYIGLSQPGAVSVDGIRTMANDAIVFAMANPTPEVPPDELADLAAVVAAGRSDYPNQINNVLAFPSVFRGALDVRARDITDGMKFAAGEAIAGVVGADELGPAYIVPSVFDREVVRMVASAVAEAAERDGVARRYRDAAPA